MAVVSQHVDYYDEQEISTKLRAMPGFGRLVIRPRTDKRSKPERWVHRAHQETTGVGGRGQAVNGRLSNVYYICSPTIVYMYDVRDTYAVLKK
jgi:hypothetical protein